MCVLVKHQDDPTCTIVYGDANIIAIRRHFDEVLQEVTENIFLPQSSLTVKENTGTILAILAVGYWRERAGRYPYSHYSSKAGRIMNDNLHP